MISGLVIHQDATLRSTLEGGQQLDVRVRPCLALLGAGGMGGAGRLSGLRAGLRVLGLSGGPVSGSCLLTLSSVAQFPVLTELLLERIVWDGGARAPGWGTLVEALVGLCSARRLLISTRAALRAQGERESAAAAPSRTLKVIVAGVLSLSEAEEVRRGLRNLGVVVEDVFDSIDQKPDIDEPSVDG